MEDSVGEEQFTRIQKEVTYKLFNKFKELTRIIAKAKPSLHEGNLIALMGVLDFVADALMLIHVDTDRKVHIGETMKLLEDKFKKRCKMESH